MKNCTFEKYLLPYLANELAPEEIDNVAAHLKECENCSAAINDLRVVDKALLSYGRQPAPDSVYAVYTQELDRLFKPTPVWKRMGRHIMSLFFEFIQSPSLGYRLARSVAILAIGVFIGRSLFITPQAPSSSAERTHMTQQPQAGALLSSADVQQLSDYFVQSELLLLSIANSTANGGVPIDDLLLNRDIAKILLSKSTTMQRKAGAINDESIIVFLNHLEFVLLELSNREDDQVHSAFQEIREIVKEADLVQKSRQLQKKMTRSLSPSA